MNPFIIAAVGAAFYFWYTKSSRASSQLITDSTIVIDSLKIEPVVELPKTYNVGGTTVYVVRHTLYGSADKRGVRLGDYTKAYPRKGKSRIAVNVTQYDNMLKTPGLSTNAFVLTADGSGADAAINSVYQTLRQSQPSLAILQYNDQ